MHDISGIAKLFLGLGVLFFVIGGFLLLGGKFFPLGRLPGDIYVRKGNFTFYFPVMTGILLSIVLSIILNLLLRR
ncbi:MAG: DUF2905 domain-containing protein [Thermoanaerobacteraceae bacterium]|nr:DUF2905 domain-containing protein [Thermoanaerobacteraceae bacterium]